MEVVTVLPPFIKRKVGTPDEGQSGVCYLAIERSECLVDLSWEDAGVRKGRVSSVGGHTLLGDELYL
jgi:hypothetical protein